jgi:carboxyl-terminal processing protease
MSTTRRNTLLLAVFLFFGCLVACQKGQDPAATSATAQAYVDKLVNEMEKYSINRKTIDWTSFRQQVNAKLQGAQSVMDTYPAIQLALTLLADNHSVYITSGGTYVYGNRSVICSDGIPAPVPVDSRIGYVKVSGFNGSGTDAINFAQAIQTAIKQADTEAIRGWIVDLRGNTGGNMWPMLAGIGPILGEGIGGYFIFPDGTISPWSYENGGAKIDQNELVKIGTPYTLRKANPKVAVLTNPVTASSGEAIAISFKGRANTRSFGAPTCGLSTVNSGIVLGDGATLILTQGTMADRSKNLYGKPVQPDETAYSSVAVDNAIAWLLQ